MRRDRAPIRPETRVEANDRGGRPAPYDPRVISVIIPVRNGGADLRRCLAAIAEQTVDDEFEIIVIDSGSTDGSAQLSRSFGARVIGIEAAGFTHGGSRNVGGQAAQGELLVFTSQDAYAEDEFWLERLRTPFAIDHALGGVYGRQLPHHGSTPPEEYFLGFLYGTEQRLQRVRSDDQLSMRTTLFSNVNSAIPRHIWEEFPFVEDIIMSEDQEWCVRVLLAGKSVYYEPTAAVRHSHQYTLKSAMQRFFDSGVSADRTYLAGARPSSRILRREAWSYATGEVAWLWRTHRRHWIPYAAAYESAKFVGLQLGARHRYLPRSLKRRLSAHDTYWSVPANGD